MPGPGAKALAAAANAALHSKARRPRPGKATRAGARSPPKSSAEANPGRPVETGKRAQPKPKVEHPEDTAHAEKHPDGQAKIPIKAVKKVYGDGSHIPLQAYAEAGVDTRRGREALVTPGDVERAKEEWDMRAVLHDIDTQWGAIPGGGAYKESNCYFGPGAYDFY